MAYLTLPPAPSYFSPYAQQATFRPGIVAGLGQDPQQVQLKSDYLNQQITALKQRALGAMQQNYARMAEEMKKKMLFSSGIQSVGVTALSAIPVVGQFLGPVAGLIVGVSSAKYMAEAKQIMAETQAKIQAMQQSSDQRINEMINRVFRAEYPAAVQLAMSGQPLQGLGRLHGLGGGFDFVKDAIDDVSDTMQDFYDQTSGRVAKTTARDESKKILSQATAAIRQNEITIGKALRDPAMRQDLRINLAEYLRKTPEFQAYARQAAQAPAGAGSTAGKLAVPAVAAGAVLLASLAL
jgi:hypothetical protein